MKLEKFVKMYWVSKINDHSDAQKFTKQTKLLKTIKFLDTEQAWQLIRVEDGRVHECKV